MRVEKIDLLRFIGLACIILAHVYPPQFLYQLRNFDVPLMVLLSGVSFGLSYKNEPYASYVWKRIKRLLLPAWIFLTAYFLLMAITGFPAHLPNFQIIATSYLLLSGIGYVWIIRIFLSVALVAPVIFRFSRNAGSHTRYFAMLGAVYIAYELILFLTRPYFGSMLGKAFESTVLPIIPYAIIFAIGLRLAELSRAQILRCSIISLVIFALVGLVIFASSGQIIETQAYKYPPSIYYLSYALGVSGMLWLVSDAMVAALKQTWLFPPLIFVAQNSLWVYLWHIPLIEIFRLPFYLKYPLVLVLAAGITWVQVRLVREILLPKVSDTSTRKNLNMLFTG